MQWRKSNTVEHDEILRTRYTVFVEELEALCKAHGFFLRSDLDTFPIIVYPAYGDEKGYSLQRTTGKQCFLYREFEQK